jgi:hypothetical protein
MMEVWWASSQNQKALTLRRLLNAIEISRISANNAADDDDDEEEKLAMVNSSGYFGY